MITAQQPKDLAIELSEKHRQASRANQHWTLIWQMFYDDPWFQRRLNDSARFLMYRCHMALHNQDDVKQEALIHFARSIERDSMLGFHPDRGSYAAFVSTVIYRCCQKGLRQFRHSGQLPIENELQHPTIDEWESLDEHLDLRHSLTRIPNPYRAIIGQVCNGISIEQIAKERNKSQRTVYRWLDKGIEQLRAICLEQAPQTKITVPDCAQRTKQMNTLPLAAGPDAVATGEGLSGSENPTLPEGE